MAPAGKIESEEKAISIAGSPAGDPSDLTGTFATGRTESPDVATCSDFARRGKTAKFPGRRSAAGAAEE
jgi:hypothetical protein